MAGSEKITTLTRQQRDIQARITQSKQDLADYSKAQQLVPAYRGSKTTSDSVWLPANGVTKAEMDHLEEVYDRIADPKELRAEITKDETALRQIGVQLADAQDDAAKAGTTGNPLEPRGTKVQRRETLGDGKTYAVTYIADGLGNFNVDTTTPPQLFGPQKTEKDTSVRDAVDLQTAQVNLTIAKRKLEDATSPQAKELAQIEVDKARLDLQKAQRDPITPFQSGGKVTGINTRTGEQAYQADLPRDPQDVSTPAGQQFIVRRAPDGTLIQEANPNYQAPALPTLADPFAQLTQEKARRQALARTELDRLQKQQADGVITTEQAARQFESWWQAQVEAPLAGLTAMAERQQQQDRLAQEAAQRVEDQRAEGINRQRQTYAYEAGNALRDKAAAVIPNVRSEAFLGKVAQAANAFGGKAAAPTWSASDFQPDPGQVPDLNAMAETEVAKALQHISPAAAARIGAPLPEIPAAVNLNDFIARYGQPPQMQAQMQPQQPTA